MSCFAILRARDVLDIRPGQASRRSNIRQSGLVSCLAGRWPNDRGVSSRPGEGLGGVTGLRCHYYCLRNPPLHCYGQSIHVCIHHGVEREGGEETTSPSKGRAIRMGVRCPCVSLFELGSVLSTRHLVLFLFTYHVYLRQPAGEAADNSTSNHPSYHTVKIMLSQSIPRKEGPPPVSLCPSSLLHGQYERLPGKRLGQS